LKEQAPVVLVSESMALECDLVELLQQHRRSKIDGHLTLCAITGVSVRQKIPSSLAMIGLL
jgi:hypothetical protein